MAETLSWQSSLSYRNQSIDLQSKTLDWFLYDRDLRHERVNIKESRTTPSTISNFLIVNFKQIQVIKGFLYFSYKLRRLGKRGNILIPTQTILIWGPIWIEAGLRWKILVSLYICFLVRVYVRNLTWKLYLPGFQFNQLCKSFLQKTFRPEFSMETVPQPEFTYSMSTIESREHFVKFVLC